MISYFKKKSVFLITFVVLLGFADVALAHHTWFPFSIFFLPIILPVETAYFWFYSNRLLHRKVTPRKILYIIFVASVLDSLFHFFVPFTYTGQDFLVGHLLACLIISVIIDWVIYIPFFRKNGLGIWNLLRISFIGNTLSYGVIVSLLSLRFF